MKSAVAVEMIASSLGSIETELEIVTECEIFTLPVGDP